MFANKPAFLAIQQPGPPLLRPLTFPRNPDAATRALKNTRPCVQRGIRVVCMYARPCFVQTRGARVDKCATARRMQDSLPIREQHTADATRASQSFLSTGARHRQPNAVKYEGVRALQAAPVPNQQTRSHTARETNNHVDGKSHSSLFLASQLTNAIRLDRIPAPALCMTTYQSALVIRTSEAST